MKHRFSLLALYLLTFAALRGATFITIGDLKLYSAYAPSDSLVQLREYIPQGETLNHWNRLASIRVFKDQKDPKAYLGTVAAGVIKSGPYARAQLLADEKTKDLILDFMMFAPDAATTHFAEWNLMRAQFVEGRGLVVYQYAMRLYEYGASTGAIVNAERNKMMAAFGHATFQEENEPNQPALPASLESTRTVSDAVQGNWVPVLGDLAGQSLPNAVLKVISLKLDHGIYETISGNTTDRGTYTIDNTMPKDMTMTSTEGSNKGKTILAIFEINGDILHICYDLSGTKRPTDFTSAVGTQLFLVTYARKKE